MTISVQLLGPILSLIAWSMVMWLWMYATRLPAVRAARIKLDPNAPRGEQMALLPAHVRWKADNYNHLLEQPTLFYALVLTLALMGVDTAASFYFAWAYVLLRVVHSLIQVLINKIELRFVLFVLSNIPLFGLLYIGIAEFLTTSGVA